MRKPSVLSELQRSAEDTIILPTFSERKDKAAAEARAEAAKKEADAKAYAGEKEAEANNKIKESITDELLKYKEIEQWNGNLPTYVGGSSDIPIISVDK